MQNQRNLLLAVLLSGLLILGWDAAMGWLYPQTESTAVEGKVDTPAEVAKVRHTREGGLTDPAEIAQERADLATSLAAPSRVAIDAPEIGGSINPVGARIDDVTLKSQRESVKDDSGPVRLFSPQGTPAQHFAQFGWIGEGIEVPDAQTAWQVEGGPLTQESPVTMRWDNGEGQLFTVRLTVDDNYLITAEQTVANTGDGAVIVRPFALLNRTSRTASQSTWTLHSGPIGYFGDGVQFGPDYDDLDEDGPLTPEGRAGWVGFTDIYWLSALAPEAGSNPEAEFRPLGGEHYRASLAYQPVSVAPGRQVTRTTRLFVGAKDNEVLNAYEQAGIPGFGNAIDWGYFGIIERPILWLLKHLYGLAGNFGVAIILLTVIVRLLMFPIAQKQFASMAAMKAVQPKMKAIQERHKDDKQKQQQEIMKLYKDEGVNPLAGCLPLLLQIPIFFGLYKVLMLSIEMRHKPFALWIEDLSAPDPAHILNLFGMLPFDVPGLIAIGPLAVLLGITMWLTFRLNPTAMDPMQRQIFSIMPWVLMFVMAPFAAGLLLYWITNNLLTLAQQSYLYSRNPQLKAQAEKDKADREKAAESEQKGKA
ncbi:membrane protein insertase YidC [Pelagerythrobacter aerophilus]|uniref:Membrane protein insertase YidC n=1 Tax=Pelagerythrobacter aerophilus TaxID=2306995 RepID=A0A418NEM3_9SPHN|nr:membrane protein insertase YidC [Pelagerythrobacter aerophilus]RIV75766.1 membrane protein insertase YidC [Pelagerythrobacter aerophilus]